jgi:hypothetical protein
MTGTETADIINIDVFSSLPASSPIENSAIRFPALCAELISPCEADSRA